MKFKRTEPLDSRFSGNPFTKYIKNVDIQPEKQMSIPSIDVESNDTGTTVTRNYQELPVFSSRDKIKIDWKGFAEAVRRG